MKAVVFFVWIAASAFNVVHAAGLSVDTPPVVDARPDNRLSWSEEQFLLGGDGAFTAAAAIRPIFAPHPRACEQGIVFNVGSGYFDGFRLLLVPRRTGYVCGFEISNSSKDPDAKRTFKLISSKRIIKAGEPVSMILAWDRQIVRFYVNGEEVERAAFAGSFIEALNRRVDFGVPGWGTAFYPFVPIRGRIWNKALDASRIAAVAKSDLRGLPSLSPSTTASRLRELMDMTLSDEHEVRRMIGTRLLFADLRERKLESARKLFAEVLDYYKGPPDARSDFRNRWADALSAAGFVREAADVRKEPQVDAGALGTVYVPPPKWDGRPVATPAKCGTFVYVSPSGSDATGDGSKERPFATAERARDRVRELKASGIPRGGVTVFFRGGRYPVRKALSLGSDDSGEEGSPITWRAYPGERPVFDGGWTVPALGPVTDPIAQKRIPVSARTSVRCCDVRKAGYGFCESPMARGMQYVQTPAPVTDLYVDGRRLTPARHPNRGFLRTTGGGEGSVFSTDMPGLAAFAAERDLVAVGYFTWLWADLTAPVKRIDTADGRVELSTPARMKPVADAPFRFENALCALDEPGEWYLDSETGVLYVWPTKGGAGLVLSSFSGTFLVADGCRHLRFGGLAFENGRGDAIRLNGCDDVTFAKNTVRNFGTDGLTGRDCTRIRVSGNSFSTFGSRAILVAGGDRKTLTPACNVICDNEIAFAERRCRTYAPGVEMQGCGGEVIGNHFHDMPSSAMRFEGNDFRVLSNLVERVVTESDDQGGIDIYYNPSYAGILIACNVFRDIGTPPEEDDFCTCGQAAVRFDGNVSNMAVWSNRFERCGRHGFGCVQINGGRNNVVEGNVFADSGLGVSITHYNDEKWRKVMEASHAVWGKEVDIRKPPYSERYPSIAGLPEMKQVNRILRNVVVGDGELVRTGAPDTVLFGNKWQDSRSEKGNTKE